MSTSIFYYYKFYLKSEKQLKNNQNKSKYNQKTHKFALCGKFWS